MKFSDNHIQELKNTMEKKSGKEVTYSEAQEAARNLTGFVEVLLKGHFEDLRRKKKLEEYPKGFVLDGVGYSCFICGRGTQAGENWYDKFGIKCRTCQDAIDRKEIPPSLAKYKENWYSKYELERSFNLKSPDIKRWITRGLLKARTVTRDGKRTHVQLFLIKDNKGFLPPKKMVGSQLVKVEKEDGAWYRSEPWYKFVDPHEHLKGYKIMEHLVYTQTEKTST